MKTLEKDFLDALRRVDELTISQWEQRFEGRPHENTDKEIAKWWAIAQSLRAKLEAAGV